MNIIQFSTLFILIAVTGYLLYSNILALRQEIKELKEGIGINRDDIMLLNMILMNIREEKRMKKEKEDDSTM